MGARQAPLRATLSSHIVASLLAERACPDDDDDKDERASYELCLAAWGVWLVEWPLAHEASADVSARREEVFFQLIHDMCTSCPCPQRYQEEEEGTPLVCQPGFVFVNGDTGAILFFI